MRASTDKAGDWRDSCVGCYFQDLVENPDLADWFMGMRRSGEDSKKTLIVSLRDPDPSIRRAAALCLGTIGPEAKEAVPALVEALSGEPEDFRWAAVWALRKIGLPAVPALMRALVGDDLGASAFASIALRVGAYPDEWDKLKGRLKAWSEAKMDRSS